MAQERTIRVDMNGELAEEWERDPFTDLESNSTLGFDDASTVAEDIYQSDDAETADRYNRWIAFITGRADEPPIVTPPNQVTRPFNNLRGSYSSPIRRTTRLNANAPIRRIIFNPPNTPSPSSPPSSPDREIVYESHDDENGHPIFIICDYTEITQKRDNDFKRKYEENGGDEFYKATPNKRKADLSFWRECADELIEPYSDDDC